MNYICSKSIISRKYIFEILNTKQGIEKSTSDDKRTKQDKIYSHGKFVKILHTINGLSRCD